MLIPLSPLHSNVNEDNVIYILHLEQVNGMLPAPEGGAIYSEPI